MLTANLSQGDNGVFGIRITKCHDHFLYINLKIWRPVSHSLLCIKGCVYYSLSRKILERSGDIRKHGSKEVSHFNYYLLFFSSFAPICFTHVRIQKVFPEGSNFLLINEWIQIPLQSDHHRSASETPFKWRFAGMPMITQH